MGRDWRGEGGGGEFESWGVEEDSGSGFGFWGWVVKGGGCGEARGGWEGGDRGGWVIPGPCVCT